MPSDVRAGDGLGLETGLLPGHWQVHAYNKDFYILRESGCSHFAKNRSSTGSSDATKRCSKIPAPAMFKQRPRR